MCPVTPTCPARMTSFPMRVLPATPTPAMMQAASPIRTLWPTCTRLSILVPRPITVSSRLPRSTQEWEPTCDVVPEDAAADVADRPVPAGAGGEPEAVAADHRAGLEPHPVARAASRRWHTTCGPRSQSSPTTTPSSSTTPGPSRHPRAEPHVPPQHRVGPDLTPRRASVAPGPMPAVGVDARHSTAGSGIRTGTTWSSAAAGSSTTIRVAGPAGHLGACSARTSTAPARERCERVAGTAGRSAATAWRRAGPIERADVGQGAAPHCQAGGRRRGRRPPAP